MSFEKKYTHALGSKAKQISYSWSEHFSETTRLIKLKFHMETPYDAGMKVCSTCHMTKMAATPIYGKTL